MKYLIPKNKINNLIYNYLDGELSEIKNDDIQFTWTRDSGGKSGVATLMKDYDYIFIYIQKKYFKGLNIKNNERAKLAPILEFEDSDFYRKLNVMFSDYWRPVFEHWFTSNYDLPVNTFIYP